ncbi:ABC transporter substrate-binding protein [Bacillus songklensis]|uniref:ABC transporter substrate-binding protein n=1 Tax=Bacillus songklensis TaxID=1069116 RepID=A0ABV8AW72_9BACI
MKKSSKKALVSIMIAYLFILCTLLIGCSNTQTASDTKAKDVSSKGTIVKVGLPSSNASYLPLFVAEKRDLFQKHHINVSFTQVQGGVTALRGLQTGDFQVISSLPESVITGVAQGANIKMIGTLDNQSMYSIYSTQDIKSPQDLKGKVVATNRPGNGTDIQLRWWLKKNGLDPNKDVRIIEAGENSTRLQTVMSGQAQMTILSQPTDLKADAAGLKKLALMRDELKNYNHNMLLANGDFLKNQPKAAKGFMDAVAEATDYAKNPQNRDEMVQLLMDQLNMKKEDAQKSLDFVLPALADKGEASVEGIKWAIDTTKQAGTLKGNVSINQLVDETISQTN